MLSRSAPTTKLCNGKYRTSRTWLLKGKNWKKKGTLSFTIHNDEKDSYKRAVILIQMKVFGKDLMISNNISPGQVLELHACFSLSEPSQDFPPLEGLGLSQVRTLFCIPPPHVTEHAPTSFHSPHAPSTEKMFYTKI